MTPEQAYSFLSSQSTPTSQAPKTPLAAYAFLAGEPVVDADNPPTLSPELLAAYQTDQAEKSAQQPGKAVQFLYDMATAPDKVRNTINAVVLGAVGHLVDGAETLISGAYRGTETGLALKQALGDESETPHFEAGKAIINQAKKLQPAEWERMLRNYDVNQAQFNAEQKRLESQGEFEGFWGGAKKIGNEALHTLGNVAENPAVIGRTLETSLAPLAIGAFNPWAGAAAGATIAGSEVLKNNQQFLETIPQYELDQSPYYNEIKSRLGLSDGEARYYIANNLAENGWNMATAAGVEFFLERFALGKLFKPSQGSAWKSALSKGAIEAGTELPQELTQTYVGNDAVIDTADRLNIHTDRKHTDGMGEAAVLAPLSGFAVGSAIGGITTAPSPRERFNNEVANEQPEASENNAQPVVQPLDQNALNQVAKQFEPTLGDEATALKAELKSDIENGNLAEAMQSQDRDYAAIARAYAQAVGFEAQNALPTENAPSDDNLFTQIKQKIVDFVGRVRADKSLREQVELMPVSDVAVQEAAEHGLDIAGFTHLIDSSSVNHIFKHHGNEKTEQSRGQIAVTDADFGNITDIITTPDMVVYGEKTNIGRDAIFYIKKAEDGSTLVVEEVRQGKKKLALTSMRKYPPTTHATSILKSLSPNVQNDFGGSGLSIVQNPKNRNKPSTIVREIGGMRIEITDTPDTEIPKFNPSKRNTETQGEIAQPKNASENIARGRQAMEFAIENQTDVANAMYREGLGWVDFIWGSVGKIKPNNKTKGGQGISHIIEARMRKDHYSNDEAVNMLKNEIVNVIALGSEKQRSYNEKQKETRLTLEHAEHEVILVKPDESNGWIISGYKQKSADGQRVGFDTTEPTHSKPTLARQGMGAAEMSLANTPGVETVSELDGNKVSQGENQTVNQSRGATTSDLHTTSPIRSRTDMGASDTNNVRPTTQDVNSSPEIQQAKAILEKALGKAYAEQVNFVRSSDFNDGRATAEGFYLNGKVHIVVDNIHSNNTMNRAERMAWVGWHEFAHNGVDVRFKGNYDAMIEMARSHPVVNVITRRIKAEYETAVANGELSKMPNENTLVEEALVELYAATKTGNWAEIESRYNTKVHRSWKASDSSLTALFERIANAMRRMVGRIIGKDLRQTTSDEIFAILKGIDQGVQSLAKNSENQTASGDARYSLNERADSAFARAVDEVVEKLENLKQGKDVSGYSNEPVKLGTTPDVFKMLGYPDVTVQMSSGVMEKAMRQYFGLPRGKHSNIHNLSPETLKQIPKQLNDPVAIYESNTKDGALVVLTELNAIERRTGENSPVIAALHFSEKNGKLDLINIASVYERNADKIARDDLSQRKVFYINKEKGRNLIRTYPSLQLASVVHDNSNLSATDIKTEADLSQYQAENSARYASGEARYSLNERADSAFAKAVDDVVNGRVRGKFVQMGTTPDVLKMLGLPDTNISINDEVIEKAMAKQLDSTVVAHKHPHNLTARDLKRLPTQLNNPIAVMKSSANSTNPNGFVILTEIVELKNGVEQPVIAALNVKQTTKGLEVVNISSVHGRPISQIKRFLTDDLLYWNKEKGYPFADSVGLHLPRRFSADNLSARNVKTEADLSQYQAENSARYSFAGRNAKTANHSLLEQAERDLASGKNAEEIRQETGWFKGVDGKWRFEIDDSQITFKRDWDKSVNASGVISSTEYSKGYNATATVGDILNAPELFAAYPDLADIKLDLIENTLPDDFSSGMYASPLGHRKEYILLKSDLHLSEVKSVLLHELQHAIQGRENFAEGANPNEYTQDILDEIVPYEKRKNKTRMMEIEQQDPDFVRNYNEMQVAIMDWLSYDGGDPDIETQLEKEASILENQVRNHPLYDEYSKAEYDSADEIYDKMDAYWATAGEVEARNVQNRINMTAEERLNRSPESTEDVQRENQIVRYADGSIANSLNENPNSDFAKAVDDVFNSDNRSIREEWIDLGTTPKPLIEAGIDDLPMFMNKQKIGKIKNEHPEMTADLLKQIPKQLNNPVAIFKNTKGKPNSYVILTELNVKNGELIIAALHANETTNGLEFHKLASAYGKDGTAAYLGNMIEKSDVRFVDKQKVRELQDTLQLLAPETLNALFDNASVVKNADESNSKFSRAARRPSVLDQIQNGEVNRENSALWQDLKQGNLKNIYRRAEDFVQQQMQDETLPVDKWAQATFDPVIARNLISAKDRAQNIRMDLNGRVSQKYITPLFKNISDLAKKYDLDLEFAQHITQYWYSARYSIEKNQEILDREKQAWKEAQQALADAQQKGDPDEISRAARAERRAKKQYNDRLHDANLTDWTKDANGEYIVKRRVGTAGGWSFAHAKAIMTAAERYIPAQDIEQAMMPLKEAVRWNIWENFRVGRITDAQKTEYLRKPNYVPLTGDPYSVLDTANSEDDFIGGAGGKNVNTSRDHTMDGRRESEADGAVDAVMGMLDKTNANSAWSEFKNIIDDVYETAYQTHIANGMTQVEARKEAQRETGISKQRLQNGTRTNDKVLIRKMGGVSYEYRLPDSVINALQKSTQETDGSQAWAFVTAPFKTVTSWLARGVTQFNPAFALTNFISDIQDKATLIIAEDVFVNGRKLSGGEMTKISGAVLKNAALSFKATGKFGFKGTEGLNMNNKMERNLKRLIELGGISNYSTYLAKTKESLRDEIKRIHKPHLKSLDGALKTVAAYNATFDYVSSLATYTALTDAGVDEKQAATVTLNLMNFRKQGEFAKYLKPFYMFINPAIQGNAKTLRLLKTNRGRAVFAVNVVKSMALYAFIAALADDDELGNTLMSNPFYPREIQIPLFGNGTLRIPLGFGVQQLSWVVGANIVKAVSGQISYGEAVGNILGASTKAVAPIAPSEISPTKSPLGWLVNTFSPQLLKPFLQLWSNRNSFGSPIVSEGGNSKLPEALQGKTETAETWKTLAQDIYDITGLDAQPEVYKHLFDSHQGMLGAFGQYLSNQIENPALEMRGKRERTLILDRFYRDLGNNKVQNYYYQAKEEAEDLLKEMEYAKESGKLAEWRTPEKIARIRWYKRGEEKLRELYQQKSALEKQRRADRIRGTNQLSDERFSERVKLINSRIEKVQRQQIHEWRKMEGLRTTLPK